MDSQDKARGLRAALRSRMGAKHWWGSGGRSSRRQTGFRWSNRDIYSFTRFYSIKNCMEFYELSVLINLMDSSYKTIKTERTNAALSWTQTRIWLYLSQQENHPFRCATEPATTVSHYPSLTANMFSIISLKF